jgi:hypothetical protein
LDGLLKDLNENLLAGLDPNPNLSRSKVKPAMYPAVRSGVIEKIVFVGGSNAKKLSQAAALLGIDAYMIAKGGWKLNRENVDKLIPDLHELLSGLPPGTPIVLFCLDNTSFLAATEEGPYFEVCYRRLWLPCQRRSGCGSGESNSEFG